MSNKVTNPSQVSAFKQMRPLYLYCPMCRERYDWHKSYGREIRCCSKSCHDEAEWRRTLSSRRITSGGNRGGDTNHGE